MNRPNFDLLLDVIDHVDPAAFDLAIWHAQTDCGTTACAIGHLALDHRANVLRFRLYAGSPMFGYYQASAPRGWDAVADFFTITLPTAEWLFCRDFYPSDATAANVVARVREYLVNAQ